MKCVVLELRPLLSKFASSKLVPLTTSNFDYLETTFDSTDAENVKIVKNLQVFSEHWSQNGSFTATPPSRLKISSFENKASDNLELL